MGQTRFLQPTNEFVKFFLYQFTYHCFSNISKILAWLSRDRAKLCCTARQLPRGWGSASRQLLSPPLLLPAATVATDKIAQKITIWLSAFNNCLLAVDYCFSRIYCPSETDLPLIRWFLNWLHWLWGVWDHWTYGWPFVSCESDLGFMVCKSCNYFRIFRFN